MSTAHEPCGRKERIALRRDDVLALRVAGNSNRKIAAQLNCAESTVRADLAKVLSVLAEKTQQNAAELRALELARLDVGFAALHEPAKAGEPRALDLWLRYSESRRRLLGLDLGGGSTFNTINAGGGGVTFNIIRDDVPPAPIPVVSTVIEPAAESLNLTDLTDAPCAALPAPEVPA